MKNKLTVLIFVGLASCFFASCDKLKETEIAEKPEITQTSIILSDGSVDGDKLTLGYLSDLLDEGLTVQEVKKIFGDDPLASQEGNLTELVYAVYTNDQYKNGYRITTITFNCKNEIVTNASIDFTGFSS